jgi:hypothetical protein
MARPKTTGNGRLRKIECPTDGMVAYVSRGAIIRHGLPYCACGMRMMFANLEDALCACPELAHEHPDFAAYTEREIRSAQRAATHVPAGRFQCGACRKFVAQTNALCDCGFHNDIRGNRNHGRYEVSGSQRIGVEMPF